MNIHAQLMKTRQDEWHRAAARYRLAAEARQARQARTRRPPGPAARYGYLLRAVLAIVRV